jgi:hypothetical protein
MVSDRDDSHHRGQEQRAASPDRRARLAKALKANIARRKAAAAAPPRAEAPAPGEDGLTPAGPGRKPGGAEPGGTSGR